MYFKGGTCAALLGWLDRFSVDLDFDYMAGKPGMTEVCGAMEDIFEELGLEIKDKSKTVPQYFLHYDTPRNERNTIKIDATFPPPKANQYQPMQIHEIGRVVTCQSKETWFANKLVAFIERHEKRESTR